MHAKSVWEWITIAAAALLALGSFLPLWARIRFAGQGSFEFLSSPLDFSAWDAYSTPVLAGVAFAFAVVGLGAFHAFTGKPGAGRGHFFALAGGVAVIALVYGVFDGPSALGPEVAVVGPGEFTFERGPLLYVGLALAIVMAVGGVLTQRESRNVPDSNSDPGFDL